jgi:uncharacterized membrane protein
MTEGSLTLAGGELLPVVAGLLALGVAGALWAWRRAAGSPVAHATLALRLAGLALVGAFLLEPARVTEEPRPGSNDFVVLVDGSKSLQLPSGESSGATRADRLRRLLGADGATSDGRWLTALGDRFRVRRFVFDERLRRVRDFSGLAFDGAASRLGAALAGLRERYAGGALAGVVILTDGSATDLAEDDRSAQLEGLPPLFPVIVGDELPPADLSVARVEATTTAFEDAPVNLKVAVEAHGHAGAQVEVQLLDEAGKLLLTESAQSASASETLPVRFRLRPERPGVGFYRVQVSAAGGPREATAANNARLVLADRGRGPHRVLYVSGRPNWEYKYLRRAVDGDPELELAALMRMAHREPRFVFIGHGQESGNPLFRGFGRKGDDTERYDEPVLVRLGTRAASELIEGFPKTPEALFDFEGLILDDLEAGFFSADQQALVERFVSERGGGLAMLGGQESFREGGYDRTPIGGLLPVYLSRLREPAGASVFTFGLSREGWLEPWVRLRDDEKAERERLAAMPPLRILNRVRGLKPGAVTLATATGPGNESWPALVTQRAGQGRVAALLLGDLWRWGLSRPEAQEDLGRFWRQTMRWLVADAPARLELRAEARADEAGGVELRAKVRDRAFAPAANAEVTFDVTAPDGKRIALAAEPSASEAGLFTARTRPGLMGGYRVVARARVDGEPKLPAPVTPGKPVTSGTPAAEGAHAAGSALEAEAGFVHDPDGDEHRSLRPNRALLAALAQRTGGRLLEPREMDDLVARLPHLRAAVTDRRVTPLWHSGPLFGLAIVLFLAEWTLRRRRGLP